MKSFTLDIAYENANFIVLNKQQGLLSQGDESCDPNIVDLLRDYLGRPYVGLVHRLDRNVSGLMVVAKRTKAARRLTEFLQNGSLKRTYLGVVEGHLHEPKTLENYLLKNEVTNHVRVVPASEHGAKISKLFYRPVKIGQTRKEGKEITLIELVLDTGRSHQIRVQMAEAGHSLVGDPKYGSGKTKGTDSPALFSAKLEFPSPILDVTTIGNGYSFDFTAPDKWPKSWNEDFYFPD